MTETLRAVATAANNGCVNPDNAHGDPDGAFTGNTSNTSWDCRWTLDDPSGPLEGTQSLTLRCRKDATGGNGDPTVTVELWDSGTFVRALATGVTLGDASHPNGVDVGGDFNANEVSGTVEVRCVPAPQGGSPAGRRNVQVDAATWVATVGVPPVPAVDAADLDLALMFGEVESSTPTATVFQVASAPLDLELDIGTADAEQPSDAPPQADAEPLDLLLDIGSADAVAPVVRVDALPLDLLLDIGPASAAVPTPAVAEAEARPLTFGLSLGPATVPGVGLGIPLAAHIDGGSLAQCVRTYVHAGAAEDVSDAMFPGGGPRNGVVVAASDGLAVRVGGAWRTVSYV